MTQLNHQQQARGTLWLESEVKKKRIMPQTMINGKNKTTQNYRRTYTWLATRATSATEER
jgi:hypothetical protein